MTSFSQILDKTSDFSQLEIWLRHASNCSPFFKRLLLSDEALLLALAENVEQVFTRQAMQVYLNEKSITNEADLKHVLRQLRKLVILRLIVRDLNGLANLFEVMHTMSDLAEVVIEFSLLHINDWFKPIYGEPVGQNGQTQELIVVGMGKLGGRELNVSSDIDLIFAYEQAGETNGGKRLSNQEYFNLVAKKLIAVIDEPTQDGFVFRVDMRLRPFGSEGVLVSSLDGLEDYYQNHGREWERYAWIKGRVIAGSAQSVTKLLKPFVYRKYLDYSMFSAMRDLKVQIQQDVDRQDRHGNIKLGRGGIREIEFIAQVFQLIRGGQDNDLQIRPTLAVLKLLAQQSVIEQSICDQLTESYIFLRNLEHRLQYYNDAQTHDLPKTESHQSVIALAMQRLDGQGVLDWPALLQKIDQVRTFVSSQFAEIFIMPQAEGERSDRLVMLWFGNLTDEEMHSELEAHGYQLEEDTVQVITHFRSSNRVKHLPDISRKRLDEQMPTVIHLCGQYSNASKTLVRMIHLLETICRRASYLAFFAEYPHVLERVVHLVSASPWLANYLTQHPILLDGLIDDHASKEFDMDEASSIAKMQTYEQRMQLQLSQLEGDTERQMNVLREFQQARLFALACEDVLNNIYLPIISRYLSDLADMILRLVIKTVWPTIKGKHREEPAFAIIAYGKHGGRELGYASDLDLVFLYDDDHPDARDAYTRLGMRIIAWLNTMTSSGTLYEIDMQLRPDGGSGLLVCSVASFAAYQTEKAWIWEHQAITRARFAAGSEVVGDAFEKIRHQIITKKRDLAQLGQEIVSMRKRMQGAFKYEAGKFDVKHGLGGMIDFEFIAQYLMLAHATDHQSLCNCRASVDIVMCCANLILIPKMLGMQAVEAYQALKRQQHDLRLQGYQEVWVPEQSMQKEVESIRCLWKVVFIDTEVGKL
ncbi:MAG TPA: bifunctional [glutamate--ammonia ligase]-adenylyl-L-tyrosine phosphorylase/[glutamate--ammonia-ligase] adenylyltransferase [Methylophilaceae bacterium]|jgi:glutamate-ammonia-ligase adenylyltransferase